MEINVPEEYIRKFIEAENTFKYSWVFDPLDKQMKPLNEYPTGFDSSSFPQCGLPLSQSLAYQLALGNVDTKTMQFINSFNPDAKVVFYTVFESSVVLRI